MCKVVARAVKTPKMKRRNEWRNHALTVPNKRLIAADEVIE